MDPNERIDDEELFASTSSLRRLYQELPEDIPPPALEARALQEAQRYAKTKRRFGSGRWADFLTGPLRYSATFTLIGILVGSISIVTIQEIFGIGRFGKQDKESVLAEKVSSTTLENKVLNDRIHMLEQQVKTIERVIVENVPGKTERKLTSSINTDEQQSYYIFQVGSYSQQIDAENIQKLLTSLGYQPTIQRVSGSWQGVSSYIDEEDSYRVQIGPFSTLAQLKTVRQNLDKIGVNALLLEISL